MKKYIHASVNLDREFVPSYDDEVTITVRDAIQDMTYQVWENYNGDEDIKYNDILEIIRDHLEDPEIYGLKARKDFANLDIANEMEQYDWEIGENKSVGRWIAQKFRNNKQIKASMEEDPEVTEAWDNYDPYSGKIYLISDTRGNVKKTDYPKNAIEYWAKMQVKDPMSVDIQTKKKVDAIKLTDFVANNPEFIYNLAEKYKLPYKPQYLISESEKKSADGQKYFYENEWGDSIHPFGVG